MHTPTLPTQPSTHNRRDIILTKIRDTFLALTIFIIYTYCNEY